MGRGNLTYPFFPSQDWTSDEQPDQENILDRFLKVKPQHGIEEMKMPSCDSEF